MDDEKKEWELAVTGIRKVSAIAKECGVRLALEPLNRYRTSVVNTAAQALKLVSDIGEENVGVHFDTYQAGIEEDSITDAFEAVLKEEKKCIIFMPAPITEEFRVRDSFRGRIYGG